MPGEYTTFTLVTLIEAQETGLSGDVIDALRRQWGLRGFYISHICDPLARPTDVKMREACLPGFASAQTTFTVETKDICILGGSHPAVIAPIVRNEALTSFHRDLWNVIASAASKIDPFFDPTGDTPVITFGTQNLVPADLPALTEMLADQHLNPTLVMNNIATIRPEGRFGFSAERRFKLGT